MTKRTPLEELLWADGRLNKERQEALDAMRRGPTAGLSPCQVTTFSMETYALTVQQLFNLQEDRPRKLQLPKPKDGPVRTQLIGQPSLALFGDSQQKVGDFPLDQHVGLISFHHQTFRYAEEFRHAPYLARTQTATANAHGQGNGHGPADITMDPSGLMAIVSDRGLGVLYHVDLNQMALIHTYRLKGKGGTSAMNVAFLGERLFVADHHAKGLTHIDLVRQRYRTEHVEWGQPSQILAAPDQQSLFVVAVFPSFCVYQIDPETLQPIKRFALKGYPFSRREDPYDAMAISPDGHYLYVMSGLDDPLPKTPIVNVLEVASGKNVHRYRLKPEKKPTGLAHAVENPYYFPPLSVPEAMIRLGFLTIEELAELQKQMAQNHLDLADRGPDTVEPPAIPDVATASLQTLAGGYEWRRFDVQPAKHLHLPHHVEVLIANYLNQRFLEETGQDLWNHPEAWTRLLKSASHVRQELQFFSGVDIVLRDLVEGHDLHVQIGRDQVQEWLITIERDDMLKGVVVHHTPDRCPQCQTPLFGVYECPTCGMETVVATQRLFDPRTLSQATLHPFAFLEPHHMLLPDPQRQRLIELDSSGIITWQLQADLLHPQLKNLMQDPVDALRLANGNTLVADRTSKRVFEVSPGGRPYWEWPSESLPLKEPIRLAKSEWGDTYVVDREGHRIYRLDPLGRPVKGFGTGKAGNGPDQLHHPTDIQVLENGHALITDSGNRRVIEVRDQQIIWQFTQLKKPVRAHRFDNGLTLILDQGDHRILGVDANGLILFQHDTYKEENGVPMDAPAAAVPLSEGRIIYWDREGLVEIDSDGRPLWAAHFDQLDAHPKLQVAPPDQWDPDSLKPRRVFNVKRLKPDELRKRALENQARLKRAQAARHKHERGLANAFEQMLRAESKKRLAEFQAKPRTWRIDFEAVRDKLRQLSKTRLATYTQLRQLARQRQKPTPPEPKPVAILAQRRPDRLVVVGDNQQVLWTWGEGLLKQPHSALQLADGHILAADTHHHRILEIDPISKRIVWEFKKGLVFPRFARRLLNGHTLITDSGNKRIVEVDENKHVVWEWGGHERLNLPNYADRLPNNHVLIADGGNHRVLEINEWGEEVWQYGGKGVLDSPESAQRLPNGNTLIADSHNHQVVEIDPQGQIRWAYYGEGWRQLSLPTYAERLPDGTTLILHAGGRAAEKISPKGQVVWRAWVPLRETRPT